ncbi:hypothetical protein QFZ75_006750 [Streptomyces sp. V3I8]|uniref:hypothetical protein n=1 Tax=Streptomyces sp. V3I8 TaxID=3042279 RepID=UPI002787696E|nr:hypothetical protein [Streptomyces sp. V3I8]MDQ1040334.1 hypothetical protein [Streptomyces sp. V3I8]
MTQEPTPSQAEGDRGDDAESSSADERGGQQPVRQTTPSQAEGDRDDAGEQDDGRA